MVGLSTKELNKFRYLMYNENYEQVLSHILKVEWEEVEKIYEINFSKRSPVILGPLTKLKADDEKGLISLNLRNWENQSVLIANNLKDLPAYLPTFFDLFYGLDIPLRMVMTGDAIFQIKIRLKNEFGNYKAGCEALGINYKNFIEFRYLSHQDLVNLYNLFGFPNIKSLDFLLNVERIGIKGKKALIENPLVTKDLFYLGGLVGSDGYTLDNILKRKSTTGFNNKVIELIMRYINILRSIFLERHVALRDPRPPEQVTYEAVTYNYALVRIINNATVKGVDVNDEIAYLAILRLPLKFIAAFVQGFFDGDGHVDLKAKMICFGIFSELRARNFQLLLKRLSIDSSVEYSEGLTTPPGGSEPVWSEKWDVRISGKLDIMRFMKLVGSLHPDKIESLSKLKDKLASRNSLTTQSRLAPKICGKYIKILRNKVGLTQKKLDKIVGRGNFTVELETGRGRSSVANVVKVINYFQSNTITNKMKELRYLKQIISNDYFLKKPYKIDINKTKTGLIRIMTSNNLLINNGLIIDGKKTGL